MDEEPDAGGLGTVPRSRLQGATFPADSRDYILPFSIHSALDCPQGFRLPRDVTRFEAGLFLPRDPPDWFGRSAYPPRILLLLADTFCRIPHVSAKEAPAICKLDAISSVGTGHMLLKGWMEVKGSGFCHMAPYNRAGQGPVSKFMRPFRGALLHSQRAWATSRMDFGDPLDLKFANALHEELDTDEPVIAQFFQAPRQARLKMLWISRQHWMAGDLLVWTAKRLLWITDRERGYYSHYGWIIRYARWDAVRRVHFTSADKSVLECELEGECRWQLPLHPEYIRGAEEFLTLLEITHKPNGRET